MAHAAEREHLRAVLGGRDVADLLARGPDRRGLRARCAVGVDLHLEAAVAEDPLRVTTVTMSTPSYSLCSRR